MTICISLTPYLRFLWIKYNFLFTNYKLYSKYCLEIKTYSIMVRKKSFFFVYSVVFFIAIFIQVWHQRRGGSLTGGWGSKKAQNMLTSYLNCPLCVYCVLGIRVNLLSFKFRKIIIGSFHSSCKDIFWPILSLIFFL